MSKVAAFVRWTPWDWRFRKGSLTEWSFGPWLKTIHNRHGVAVAQHAGCDLGPIGTVTATRRRKIVRTEPM